MVPVSLGTTVVVFLCAPLCMRVQYFKAFFLIFGVFLTIWMTALAAVHCPRPRSQLKRKMAALRGELTPLKGPLGPAQAQAQAQALARGQARRQGRTQGAPEPGSGVHEVQVVERHPGASPVPQRPEAGHETVAGEVRLGEGRLTAASGPEGEDRGSPLKLSAVEAEAQSGHGDTHVLQPLRADGREAVGVEEGLGVQGADGHRTPPVTPDASDRAPGDTVSPGLLQGS